MRAPSELGGGRWSLSCPKKNCTMHEIKTWVASVEIEILQWQQTRSQFPSLVNKNRQLYRHVARIMSAGLAQNISLISETAEPLLHHPPPPPTPRSPPVRKPMEAFIVLWKSGFELMSAFCVKDCQNNLYPHDEPSQMALYFLRRKANQKENKSRYFLLKLGIVLFSGSDHWTLQTRREWPLLREVMRQECRLLQAWHQLACHEEKRRLKLNWNGVFFFSCKIIILSLSWFFASFLWAYFMLKVPTVPSMITTALQAVFMWKNIIGNFSCYFK